MTAVRIQRKRTKGWRMPEGAVYVGRPTVWGNPFIVSTEGFRPITERRQRAADGFRGWLAGERYWFGPESDRRAAEILGSLGDLRGRDLACWCPLDWPCHADVLLELANA